MITFEILSNLVLKDIIILVLKMSPELRDKNKFKIILNSLFQK